MSVRVVARAPVRIADLGAWTDTWFAGQGRVCSIAVQPGAYVDLRLSDRPGDVTLVVGSTGDRYQFAAGESPGLHPLLEACVAALPPSTAAVVEIGADVPPGSGLGTSAAVTVALLCALATAKGISLSADELASMAHSVETGLGWQCGVQDQWAAAHGGVSDLTIDYPKAAHRAVSVDDQTIADLNRRLMTIYLGSPHSSSALHEEVITMLATSNPGPTFRRMRESAEDGARALVLGDLNRYGAALIEHHEAMRQLHPGLIGKQADAVIAIARGCGALGWKMNGAGGDGGTITVLGPALPHTLRTLRDALGALTTSSFLDLQFAPCGVTSAIVESDDGPAQSDGPDRSDGGTTS